MHRMNPPVAAGSEKLGTIVTVVSSAMKAICLSLVEGAEKEKKEGKEETTGVEVERKKERKNCAHLSL